MLSSTVTPTSIVPPPPPTTQKTPSPPPTSYFYARRQVTVTPSSIPTYASACSGTARYSSTCSCYGITGTATTPPTPVKQRFQEHVNNRVPADILPPLQTSAATITITMVLDETTSTTTITVSSDTGDLNHPTNQTSHCWRYVEHPLPQTPANHVINTIKLPTNPRAVCNPTDNYGQNFVSGASNAGPGQSNLATYSESYGPDEISTSAACWAYCFTASGCLTYSSCDNACSIEYTLSGKPTASTAQCL
ncbi:hypothetical protein MMC08_001184 [Hypocenomyce scalaris]|nr:hypothetical protein [Hypocenomyce scalaris]